MTRVTPKLIALTSTIEYTVGFLLEMHGNS